MENQQLVDMMKALGDETRLEIVSMLGNQELCACEILSAFHLTQPTLSHHMRILCESGLIHCEKTGKWNHYTLNLEKFEQIKAFVETLKHPVTRTCSSCKE